MNNRDGQVCQEFVSVGDVHAVERFVESHGDHDLYFGVAARLTPKNGTLSNCGVIRAVFVDVDFKETGEYIAREKLLEFFGNKTPTEVRSGGF